MITNQPLELTTDEVCSEDEVYSKENIVILHPITMRIPNRHFVYSPSKLKPKKIISYEKFLERYADHPRKIRVCFDETLSFATIFQKSELVTAYGFGSNGWYIVATIT